MSMRAAWIIVAVLSISGAAAAAPAAVRIAAIGYAEGGQVSVRGTGVVARVIDEGWLEKQLADRGVRLEWVPVVGNNTGAVTNEAFAAGRIDFANYGDFPSVTLNAAGFRTQVVVPSGRGSDMFLVVPPGSPAKSIHDLKGQRISVHRGRPWDLGLQKLLQASGLKESDFRILNLNPQAGVAALAAGKVDAHFGLQAHVLEERGMGKIIWSSAGKPLHLKMRAELWGASGFLRAQPELTQLVATAYVKAAHWVAQDENFEAVVKIGTRNGTPAAAVRKAYLDPTQSWRDRWSVLPDQTVLAHYRDVVAFAAERGLTRKPVRPEDLIEPRFVNQALADLKLQDFWQPRPASEVAAAGR